MNMEMMTEEVTENRSAQAIHKQVLMGEGFQPRTFYRVPLYRSEMPYAERFLRGQFGEPRPHHTWWVEAGSVFMDSQTYTWWCLAHGIPR